MLVEPELDAERLALDRALLEAMRRRIEAGVAGPDAAAIALRTLVGEIDDPYLAATLRAVWGRMEQAGRPPLNVFGPAALLLAADRYGPGATPATDAEAALAQARQGAPALIDLDGPRPWWGRLLVLPNLRVVAALPDDRLGRPRTLMVSREVGGPTGDDRTFWITDSGWSDTRILDALGRSGLAATPLAATGGLKLFMLSGYVQAEDGRLDDAPGSLRGVIGAAPIF